MLGMGEKIQNESKKREKQGKNSPFSYPSIPTFYDMKADRFRCPRTPKTSLTYPIWEGDLI